MAYSAPLYMEVRWRLHGSDEAWSEPRRVNPVREVVVEELDRTKQYDFEARNVSACGAKSDWVPSTHTVPDVPAGNLTLADIKTEADNAAADALAANAELANIASDNVLSQGEKPVVIRDTNVITTEQAGIDAQATAFGITTEKTAYDAAVTALTTYLAALTTPVLWSNLTGDTTIVGTTFRSKFADVYTTRQALLNAIYAAAKSKADAAQSTANAANANTPAVVNPQFSNGLTGWSPGNPTGWYVQTGGGNLPDPIVNTAAVHAAGGGAATTDTLFNAGHIPVVAGQQVTVTCCVGEVGANAGALGYARISWRDASNAEIGVSAPSGTMQYPTCGAPGTGTYTQCVTKVIGIAPSGAQYAVAEPTVTGHTTGYFLFCNVCMVAQPSSVDELPDGSTYARVRGTALFGNVPIPLSSGKSLIANTRFTSNAVGVTPGTFISSVGAAICDGWSMLGVDSAWGVIYENGSGNADILVRLKAGVSIAANSTQNAYIGSIGMLPIPASDAYSLTVSVGAANNVGLPAGLSVISRAYVRWYKADGTPSATPVTIATDVTGTSYSTSTRSLTNNAPSDAAFAAITLQAIVVNSTGAAINTPAGLGCDMRFSRVQFVIASNLANEVAGTLSTQRNLPLVTWGNYGGGWSGLSITYNTTTTSCTFTASSGSYVGGGDSIAYNSGSVSVSGSAGSTVTYYLYYDDPGMTGGSKSLQATTNQITSLNAAGRVLLGKATVTYPTSGTGSGGGGTGCPDENAWVLRADPHGLLTDWCVRAKEIEVGHHLRLTDGRAGLVTYSERKSSRRVRVVAEGGKSLTCSDSAPLELAHWQEGCAEGACVPSPMAAGRALRIYCDRPVFAARIDSVEDAGSGFVQHITCENACFWTGDDPDYLFGHHNLKPIP